MSNIRSKNTKAETIIFRGLSKRRIYFQKHYKKVIGAPDIALPRKKKAVFIDGDFWHGYNFIKLKGRLPKKYWISKIEQNIKRDNRYKKSLRRNGWAILRVWEHEILKTPDKMLRKIENFLAN